jgi:hypothetical protein
MNAPDREGAAVVRRHEGEAVRPVMFDRNCRRNPLSWLVLQSFPNARLIKWPRSLRKGGGKMVPPIITRILWMLRAAVRNAINGYLVALILIAPPSIADNTEPSVSADDLFAVFLALRYSNL